jgi:hypothetical protein
VNQPVPFPVMWQGCEDSNLGMTESESVALPLGDTPTCEKSFITDSGKISQAFS